MKIKEILIQGFSFLGLEAFSCPNDIEGEKRFDVPVYRCDAFAKALGISPTSIGEAIDTEFVLMPPPAYGSAKPAWDGKPFLIARTCVTQRVYDALGGEHDEFDWSGPMQSANKVSWDDAQAWFKDRLQETWLRLPTEKEWEFACRAGTETEFCFGDADSGLGDYAWYSSNSGLQTHDVGGKRSNAFGLYDMHGSLWEWCEDLYKPGASLRVLRGGSWYNLAEYCRSADRGSGGPGLRYDNLGLRPARSLEDKELKSTKRNNFFTLDDLGWS